MQIHIHIDGRLVRTVRATFTRRRVFLGLLLLMVAGGATAVAVGPSPVHSFTPGTTISSAQVNENFTHLYAAVHALESVVVSGAVAPAALGADAVREHHIAANAVTRDKILDGAVTYGKLATDAVVATNIASGQVTNGKLAIDAVSTSRIRDGAVTGSKLDANAVGGGLRKEANVVQLNEPVYVEWSTSTARIEERTDMRFCALATVRSDRASCALGVLPNHSYYFFITSHGGPVTCGWLCVPM